MKAAAVVLTKAQQRVAVAYDVIASLRVLKLRTGAFIETDDKVTLKGDSKVVAQKLKRKCEVCALGACLLSVVSLNNEFDFLKANDKDKEPGFEEEGLSANPLQLVERLSKIFSFKQLAYIENTFEEGKGWFKNATESPYVLSSEERERCVEFSDNFNSDEHRLRAIMYNIIENKGTFKP